MTNKPFTTRGPCVRAALTLLAIVLLAHRAAAAADLDVAVLDPAGKGVAGVVIVAEAAVSVLDKHAARTAVMDQRNMRFVPNILVVQTGTGVSFPNSDQIRHQVYSFSPAKAFQLSLYAGSSSPRVIFDHPGLVTVGCNIHDSMIGYIYVSDSPFFGRTDASGHLQLGGLPAGSYTLRAWHPQMREPTGPMLQLSVVLTATDHATRSFRLTRPWHEDTGMGMGISTARSGGKRWDY